MILATLAVLAATAAAAEPTEKKGVEFDAGADLRIRGEIIDNVPGLPQGGLATPACAKCKHHLRFRPRFWGELKGDAGEAGKWRLFARLTDEFRWNVEPYKSDTTWPGELILDNLFVEGTGLFDELLDVKLGRQDLFNYCGLNHVFVDGTPGDGSRDVYTDMASVRLRADEESYLNVFGLYNFDDNRIRWGTQRSAHKSLAARFPTDSCDSDDWGYGAIWTSKLAPSLGYQLFAMQKQMTHTGEYRNHTEMVGAKLMPQWNEEWSSAFEAMAEMHGEWSSYADIGWKKATGSLKPYARLGYHFMSRDWDAMWARGANDSELFLYGSHNGISWWSNMHYVKLTAGLEFSPHHALSANTGPMFAAERDFLSGSDGRFKGLLSQVKYEFPILPAGAIGLKRVEVFGMILAEYFNPGDYFDSKRPACYLRWQLDFRF